MYRNDAALKSVASVTEKQKVLFKKTYDELREDLEYYLTEYGKNLYNVTTSANLKALKTDEHFKEVARNGFFHAIENKIQMELAVIETENLTALP